MSSDQQQFLELIRDIPKPLASTRRGIVKWLWKAHRGRGPAPAFVIFDKTQNAERLEAVLSHEVFGVTHVQVQARRMPGTGADATGFILTSGPEVEREDTIRLVIAMNAAIQSRGARRKNALLRRAAASVVDSPMTSAA